MTILALSKFCTVRLGTLGAQGSQWGWLRVGVGRKPNFETYALEILARKKLRSKKTYVGAKTYLTRFAEFFRGLAINEINDAQWLRYCVWRRSVVPNCTLYDDRKHLNCVLLAAFREGVIRSRVHLTRQHRDFGEAGREITTDELARLYRHADPELELMMDIALYLGLRKNEMLGLRWDRIDWQKREVHLRREDTKGKRKGRVVPIHDVVFPRLLERYECRRDGANVFPGRFNARLAKTENRKRWETCKRKAAVETRWHDLRHTSASWLVRANVPLPVISRMLGMTIKVLMNIYAKVQTDDLWEASRKLAVRVQKINRAKTDGSHGISGSAIAAIACGGSRQGEVRE